MNKKSINVKTALKQEAAVSYLEALAKSIKSGKIVVQAGDEFVSLLPSKVMELEVSAARKKGKERLTFELSWVTEVEALGDVGLLISSVEPAVAPKVIQVPAANASVTKGPLAKTLATKAPVKSTPAGSSSASK